MPLPWCAPLADPCDDRKEAPETGHEAIPSSFRNATVPLPTLRAVDTPEPGVRLAEVLAALSLGIDLGFGQPMEHVLRQCRIAMRLCDLIETDEETRAAAYYSALLVNIGCHTDAHEQVKWFGDDIAFKTTKYADSKNKL